jgi:hypothetical protein
MTMNTNSQNIVRLCPWHKFGIYKICILLQLFIYFFQFSITMGVITIGKSRIPYSLKMQLVYGLTENLTSMLVLSICCLF